MLLKTDAKQIRLLFWITMANFIAQVPYFFRLYYRYPSDLTRLFNLPMLLVFALFVVAYVQLINQRKSGFRLMVLFLVLEFSFYLLNAVLEVTNGLGLFFHLRNPDPVLWTVFAIGYLNLFASGYFLVYLYHHRNRYLQ